MFLRYNVGNTHMQNLKC